MTATGRPVPRVELYKLALATPLYWQPEEQVSLTSRFAGSETVITDEVFDVTVKMLLFPAFANPLKATTDPGFTDVPVVNEQPEQVKVLLLALTVTPPEND